MTLVESIHLIVKPEDRVSTFASEATESVSLTIDNFPRNFILTLGTQHIPQVEQLLTLLWAIKEEQETKAQKQLEAALKEVEAQKDYYSLTAEF